VSRFSEAISEGDGISVIPVLEGDVGALAALAEEAGAEAVAVRAEDVADARARTGLEELYGAAYNLGLDFAVDVREEEELGEALERIDPEIVLISERGLDEEEEDLELTLDLLADVPAGKLVVSEARIVSHDQVVALERAGVDAILVHGLARAPDFGALLEELVHGPEARR
jgi:indole-3-glycerol phosphate synthase